MLGSLGAAALVPVALATDNDFWFALAFTGFFLNLFNLLPVVPLDGGRAFAAMAPWMWFVGLFAVVVLCFVAPNPILLLIALFAGLEMAAPARAPQGGCDHARLLRRCARRTASPSARSTWRFVVLLVVGMDLTFAERSLDDA